MQNNEDFGKEQLFSIFIVVIDSDYSIKVLVAYEAS